MKNLNFPFFNKQILGVDIGARTIKGVKLKRGKSGRVALAGHFFQDLSKISPTFPAGSDRNEALKAVIETQKLGSSNAATTIRDTEVMTFNLQLPVMSEKELIEVVPQEIAEQAHIAIEEHSCDFIVTPGTEPDLTQVKAYCVKKDVVLEQMEVLSGAGLKPSAIESEMMAVMAMLEFNDYVDPGEILMVVDLGESHLTAGLISEGNLHYPRSHDVSFGAVNRALQEQFKMTYDEAEVMKLGYDFFTPHGENAGTVTDVLDDVFTQIFKFIKESLEFYKECAESYGRVDKILLMGGGSQIKDIEKVHEMFFKTPTVIVNPFRNIDIFNAKDEESNEQIARLAPYMGTAVGLALASIPLKEPIKAAS